MNDLVAMGVALMTTSPTNLSLKESNTAVQHTIRMRAIRNTPQDEYNYFKQ
jgi:hypothetical protein